MYAEECERIITIQANCCCLSQIIKDGTGNCANNKELIFILFVTYELFVIYECNNTLNNPEVVVISGKNVSICIIC